MEEADVHNNGKWLSGQYPRHRHHNRHRRHKRGRLSPLSVVDSPFPEDGTSGALDPDLAFRESLFDAMGDDEGAAYWESVYGQPIHTYPDAKLNAETGELEKMNDEEYVAFVRKGMWERSWEGIEAQREQRRRDKLRKEREREQKEAKGEKPSTSRAGGAGADSFDQEIEESLSRGRRRKMEREWREKWGAYERAWDDLYGLARSRETAAGTGGAKTVHLRNEIRWPVESGKRKDVSAQEIERFMIKTAESVAAVHGSEDSPRQLLSHLKVERVRWHPDKVQHRFGSLNVDEGMLKGVTEVFQVMDRLYHDTK